ncbi:MAG: sulfatase [Acidobacteria bacterium]|nr:sulfatase [Acidobacteriota bacterium]
MNRRGFLQCAAGAAAGLCSSQAQAARPLNFVFILADDLGWADTGCYGADLHETPNIDRLAREGVRFTDAYSAAPVCSPTRAALMTGKHPARLHMTTWFESSSNPPKTNKLIPPVTVSNLPHSEVTVAEALRTKGYLNALVGKWHLGSAGYYPETQGFDVNIGGTQWGAPQTFFYPYSGSRNYGGEFRYVPHLEFGQPGEYLTDRLTTEALNVVDKAKSQPFFLYLAHHAVHTPVEGKQALVDRYQSRVRPGMHHKNARYAAMMASLDESVGRVMRKIEESGMGDRTVVIFSSDNGGYINPYRDEVVTDNSPLRSGKGSLYEGGIRVPLIVRWPGVTAAGAVCREPVVSMDLYSTLLDAAGMKGSAEYGKGVDGLSLTSLLRQPKGTLGREALYFHYPHYYATTSPVSAIRAGDWKLLEYDDLSEKKDLATALPGRASELGARLAAWRQSMGAQMPAKNPNYPVGSDTRPSWPDIRLS